MREYGGITFKYLGLRVNISCIDRWGHFWLHMRTKHCLAKNICCILESCRIYYSNCNYISLGRQQASSEIGSVWGNLMTLFCHVECLPHVLLLHYVASSWSIKTAETWLSHELVILHIPQMLLNPRSMCFLSCVCVLLLQEPQPIDWEYYRKGIGSKVVDMYKEAYESKYPLLQN